MSENAQTPGGGAAMRPVKAPATRQGESQQESSGGDDEIEFSPQTIAIVCGVLLLLALGLYFIGSGDDEPSDTVGPATTLARGPVPPGGSAAPPTTSNRPKQPTGGPPGVPTDSFDGEDGPIGAPWSAVGVWVRSNNHLALEELDGKARFQFLTRDIGSANGTVSAVASYPVQSSALVFRYVDQQNFWMLRPAPQYGTWALIKVVDGDLTNVASTNLSPTEANTTATVELDGPNIRVQLDGKDRVGASDVTHQTATRAGFVMLVDRVPVARWDYFYGLPS